MALIDERWFRIETTAASRVALVLDVSDRAPSHWRRIGQFARTLLRELPPAIESRVFFLGGGGPYPAAEFASAADSWRAMNAGRGRLITPVFEAIEQDEATVPVIAGAGAIFDLEDWSGTDLLSRARFVAMGGAPLTDGLCPEVGPAGEALRRELASPVVEVEVKAAQGMPFFWDNPSYRLQGNALVARETGDFSVRIGLLLPRGDAPRVVARLAAGVERAVSASPCDPVAVTTEWGSLTGPESERFRRAREDQPGACPHCGERHPPSEPGCPAAGNGGAALYPSLARLAGFVLLRDAGDRVRFRAHPCAALRTRDEVVAVLAGAGADLVAFDPLAREWRPAGRPFVQYDWLGDRTYAVVL